ncbi:preprotein translocase subunit SecA [Parvicella tangerina]|uniref:Protein translocase subunit SecA n=1 Tax=Parvicella tangerina TaxID=2829795 RepID=A0A916JNL1_9FLAO|nr:preprotein translocase subunit SecA [Parvicella tangerina]CAG5084027.1 Protein translocase subunit SecA [Parvicella tangerina]
MIKSILNKIFGDKSQKDLKELEPYVGLINEEYAKLSSISNDDLRKKTVEFKNKIKDYTKEIDTEIVEMQEKAESADTPVNEKELLFEQIEKKKKEADEKIEEILMELLPQAFAVIKETARRFTENETIEVPANESDEYFAANRDHVEIVDGKAIWQTTWDAAGTEVTWNMVHYDVQLMGGTALHQGKIAEMQTGEGKTLVATLPVYLNALAGKGVHLVTVNDYLAKRDSEWMGPLYEFHGLRVDCIDKHQPNSASRRLAYEADITFGTNNEFGFDYLRDNMTSSAKSIVQKKHHYAIIDEVDSVLIDDARTPLIISGPTPKGDEQEYNFLKPKVEKLVNAQKKVVTSFLTEAKQKLAQAEKEGIDKKEQKKLLEEGGLALFRAYRGLPKTKAVIKYLSEPGIKTHMQKVENFYLQDNRKEMPKADAPLFFTIEEKTNSIDLTEKGIDLISGSDDPSFYILPDIGVSMTEIDNSGKSAEEKAAMKDELITDYSAKAERIHSINQLLKAYALFEKDVEYVVLDNKVKIVDEQTGRIMDGRRYSDGLHQAIEAKENVKVEAATQTYATITLQNFFRMYHKLAGMTGTAETEAKELWDIYELDVVVVPTNKPIAREDKDDLVYKTAREKYNAIIDEVESLRNAGRPVLVGTTNVEISELLSRMLKMKKIPHQVLNAKLHQSEAEVVAEAGKAGTVTIATNMAGRGTDIKLQEGVKEAGGLAIIGTERHDSRRVDRQLRGRAGRQGDVGSSQFFVSLEDNLMRLFGSERISRMMDRMGHKDGEVIQHGMITKSIERAQKKVEENNFGVRKRLLEFDDVMNSQRTAIYSRRRNALFGDKLDLDIDNMFYETSMAIVNDHHEGGLYEDLSFDTIVNLGIEPPFSEEEFFEMDINEATEKLYHKAVEHYNKKKKIIQDKIFTVVQNIYQQHENPEGKITIPFTDGKKGVQVRVDIKEAHESKGAKVLKELEKGIILALIDNEWKEHLREMDDLKSSVYHAQYEQKDPLLIYKLEGYNLFREMLDNMNKEILSFITKVQLPEAQEKPNVLKPVEVRPLQQPDNSNVQTSREDVTQATQQNQQAANRPQNAPVKKQPAVSTKKYGRNDRVKVLNLRSGETQEMKFKQAESLIVSGAYQLVEED